jgi:transcriptional regulator with XRE-family HTH domain
MKGMAVETIGQRIKRERLALKMTQRELAEAVDVGVPHISKVEAGRENPSDDLLRRLARVFKADVDELLLVARRLPETMMEDLAADPAEALMFLRTFREKDDTT